MRGWAVVAGVFVVGGLFVFGAVVSRPDGGESTESTDTAPGSSFAKSQTQAVTSNPHTDVQAAGGSGVTGSVGGEARGQAVQGGLLAGPGVQNPETDRERHEEPGALDKIRRLFTDAKESSESRQKELERTCNERDCLRCVNETDCPSGQGCGFQLENGKFQSYCMPSNCKTDTDCSDGLVCRRANSDKAAVEVLRCVKPGGLSEGERCFQFSSDPKTSCAPGLVCPLLQCARPCSATDQCRAGERCVRGACTKHCDQDSDCGASWACVRSQEFNFCRKLLGHQPNCDEPGSECDPGQACLKAASGQAVVFSCNQCCSATQPCGAGFVCGAAYQMGNGCPSACFKACTQNSECGQNEACSFADREGGQRACVPTVPNNVVDRPGVDGGASTVL